jgi:hypothetical protein
MHINCLILGLGLGKISLGILESILCGFDTRTCISTLLQTTRAIGEYYFWYDQILAPLPGIRCFVRINFVA